MKIKKFKWKQTASKNKNNKCSLCRKWLAGEEGFVFIKTDEGWRGSSHIRICLHCFKKFIEEMKEKKKTKTLTYRKLVKRVILNKLK